MNETRFIQEALGDPGFSWNYTSLAALAGLQAPDNVLGRRQSLLRADINEQWARWFVESLADPRRYAATNSSYPHLFNEVFQVVDQRFTTFTRQEKQKLASTAARILQQGVTAFQSERRRQQISGAEKSLLIDLAGNPPRCWICGGQFTEEAIDNFIRRERREIPLPMLIDILKPRGLKQRDLSIEIDHVVPHAQGGTNEDNLKLACGWCNRHKSNFTSIYDVDGRPSLTGSNSLGIKSIPQPFWTVRLLAVGRCCEHQDGCGVSADYDAVTIAPIVNGGAMNPSNLRVTCYAHDPLREVRFQPKSIVMQIWGV